MKIYTLIWHENCEVPSDPNVELYLSEEAAHKAMCEYYEEALENSDFDLSAQDCLHSAYIDRRCAGITVDTDSVSWRIEEHNLDVSVAVEVKGGMVQSVHANANVIVDVYDMDIPDFSNEQKETEAEAEAMAVTQELQICIARPGWRCVY